MRPSLVRVAPALVACAVSLGCIPEGPSTKEGPAPSPAPKLVPNPTASAAEGAPGEVISGSYEDDFERDALGADWLALSPAWKLSAGRLCVRGAKNRGIWLQKKLPTNARIEFDAYADSAEGDLKVELWGDGKSGATGTSYGDATSYLAILGGWKNTKHVFARLDEHGDDRLELDIDKTADDERLLPVSQGQPYRFQIERSDGRTVEWSVGGLSYFVFRDPEPLSGEGHEHLGFNDWDVPVCFDNLRIVAL